MTNGPIKEPPLDLADWAGWDSGIEALRFAERTPDHCTRRHLTSPRNLRTREDGDVGTDDRAVTHPDTGNTLSVRHHIDEVREDNRSNAGEQGEITNFHPSAAIDVVAGGDGAVSADPHGADALMTLYQERLAGAEPVELADLGMFADGQAPQVAKDVEVTESSPLSDVHMVNPDEKREAYDRCRVDIPTKQPAVQQ